MGKFERALKNNEISTFFKGEGEYFSPEEFNMGYHNEVINWQEWLSILERKKIGVLDRYLKEKFVKVPNTTNMRPVNEQMNLVNEYGCPYNFLSF